MNPMTRAARTLRAQWPLLLLAPLVLLALAPLAWMFISSFKTPEDFAGSLFLPQDDSGLALDRLTFANYRRAFQELAPAMANSAFIAGATAILAMLVCSAAGFALAMRWRGRSLASATVWLALIVPGPILVAPAYLWLSRLGLLNSYWGVILPAVAPAFGVLLYRQAIRQAISPETIQAATLDGCSAGALLRHIVLPGVRATTAIFLLIVFMTAWNAFLWPQLILLSPDKMPLSVALAQARDVHFGDRGLLMAGTMISILPIALLFLLVDRPGERRARERPRLESQRALVAQGKRASSP